MSKKPSIVYTKTDEAPALATYSFLPIIQAVSQVSRDRCISKRHFACWTDPLSIQRTLNARTKVEDALAALGALAKNRMPTSLSCQTSAHRFHNSKGRSQSYRQKGYALPDYPETPQNDTEAQIKAVYDKVKGSAVNPVLREGNSDRRAPKAVKEYAKKNPHSMGEWVSTSMSHVSTMSHGDFRHNEQSVTCGTACTVRIEHIDDSGRVEVLKDGLALQTGEVIDATYMSKAALERISVSRNCRCKNHWHFIFAAHESDDDEGIRSDYLWARRTSVL